MNIEELKEYSIPDSVIQKLIDLGFIELTEIQLGIRFIYIHVSNRASGKIKRLLDFILKPEVKENE